MKVLHKFELLLLTVAINTQIVYGGELTDMDTLYNHMFTNYSAKTKPVLDHTDQVNISVISFISNINNFDEKISEFSVTLTLILSWKEERISWDPALFNGISSMSVCPEDLWRPKLFLLEESDMVKNICNTSIQPRIWNDGAVIFTTGNVFKVSCSVDVLYFPYDQQTCELTLLDWDVYTTSTDVSLIPNVSTVQRIYYKTNSQWEVRSGALRSCTDISGACINLLFVLKRRSNFFVMYIIVPLVFLALINNLVFLMPANSGERTSVAVTTFLSFVVYMGIVNDVVPQSSDPMAYIYYYIMYLMIYSCIIMFLCICSLRIYDSKAEVPKWLSSVVWYLRFKFVLIWISKVADKTRIMNGDNLHMDHKIGEEMDAHNANIVKEIDGNDLDTVSCATEDTFDKGNVYNASWYTVGRTFDCYCCTALYLSLLFFTLYTFINLGKNEDPYL